MSLSSTHSFPSLPFPDPSLILNSSFFYPSFTLHLVSPCHLSFLYLPPSFPIIPFFCLLNVIPPSLPHLLFQSLHSALLHSDLLCFSFLFPNLFVTPPYHNPASFRSHHSRSSPSCLPRSSFPFPGHLSHFLLNYLTPHPTCAIYLPSISSLLHFSFPSSVPSLSNQSSPSICNFSFSTLCVSHALLQAAVHRFPRAHCCIPTEACTAFCHK